MMRRLSLGCLIALFFQSFLFAQEPAIDPIIGTWHGVGIMEAMVWVFNADHTNVAGADPGRWTRESDGTYGVFETRNPKDTNPHKAHIDDKGRLVIEMGSDPDRWYYLVKSGETKTETETPPDPKGLLGRWRYAYTKDALFELAPLLDDLNFTDSGTVQGTFTLLAQKLQGGYRVSGNRLRTQLGSLTKLDDVTFRFEDGGKTLILSPVLKMTGSNDKYVFLRPDRTLSNELIGTWAQKRKMGMDSELQIRADGKAVMSNSMLSGGKTIKDDNSSHPSFCLFWKSNFGKTLTTLDLEPQLGFVMTMRTYERKGDTMTLTPIDRGPDGDLHLQKDHSETWTLKSPANPAAPAKL